MPSVLITNARIVNENRIVDGDVLLRDGHIDAIGGDLAGRNAERIVDGAGRYLLPGLIDSQVHFREPGLEHKADIATESAAAVAGGVTSFFEMPNTKPPTLTRERLEDKYSRASGRSRANFAFFLGAGRDNAEELDAVDPATIPGIKIFMGSSTGNMLVDEPETLARIFSRARVPVVTHCEDTPTIEAREKDFRARHGDALSARHHPQIRNHEACWRSSSLAVALAREHGAQLHILHLSTARELELFSPGPIDGKQITSEACIHHLSFDDRDYAELGNRIKCNPAIKTAADRNALLAALREDRIDILATDHAPHTLAEKEQAYIDAPAGLPLIQQLLPGLLTLVADGELSIESVVEKSSHNVARRFGLADRGFIREGCRADLVLADPDGETVVTDNTALSKCGWTPFHGRTLRGRVDMTLVNGEVAWENGSLTRVVAGERLYFVHPER